MIPNSSPRNTVQKIKIIEYLNSVKTHPTAEQVYNAVKKELPSISLGTVYRNLKLLADQGKILKLEINNESRFDATTCNHQHCVCSTCGNIIDIDNQDISDYALRNIGNDFIPDCVTIIYRGHCRNCKQL